MQKIIARSATTTAKAGLRRQDAGANIAQRWPEGRAAGLPRVIQRLFVDAEKNKALDPGFRRDGERGETSHAATFVIPAKAGSQRLVRFMDESKALDPGFRRDDEPANLPSELVTL